MTKVDRRDLVFRHLNDGALFVADDLLPQDKWTEAHHPGWNGSAARSWRNRTW